MSLMSSSLTLLILKVRLKDFLDSTFTNYFTVPLNLMDF